MKTCTCPHHYGPAGLEKYGTNMLCPFHGAPLVPTVMVVSPPEVLLEPRSPMVDCEACGYSHPGGALCPDL